MHVLMTGGSGLIGTELSKILLEKGHQVSHLSRHPKSHHQIKAFGWDVKNGIIDEACIDGVDTIIHLAGAGIADYRWTEKRKKELIESRTRSIALIYDLLRKKPNQVKKIISASATGFYSDRGDVVMHEDDAPAHDFLGECCIAWEQAVDEGAALGLEILKFRTGVVLTRQGGALPKLALPVKFAAGAPLGDGKQWIPWIHHQDVCAMYVFGLEHNITGNYNMVAPQAVTNAELTKAVAKQLKKPLWLPKVPAVFLKLIFGEMAIVVLGSTRVSAEKIERQGFQFKYPDIDGALEEIYG